MKLPVLSSSEVERVLRRAGFEPAPKRGKGSHKAFVKQTKDRKFLVRGIFSFIERVKMPSINLQESIRRNLQELGYES